MQGYIVHTCLRHDVPFVSGCVLHTHQKSKVPLVCRYDLNSYVPTSRWKSSKPMRSLLRSRPSRSLALLALAVASASALCNIFWKSPASIWQSLKSLERKTLFGSTLNLSLKSEWERFGTWEEHLDAGSTSTYVRTKIIQNKMHTVAADITTNYNCIITCTQHEEYTFKPRSWSCCSKMSMSTSGWASFRAFSTKQLVLRLTVQQLGAAMTRWATFIQILQYWRSQ